MDPVGPGRRCRRSRAPDKNTRTNVSTRLDLSNLYLWQETKTQCEICGTDTDPPTYYTRRKQPQTPVRQSTAKAKKLPSPNLDNAAQLIPLARENLNKAHTALNTKPIYPSERRSHATAAMESRWTVSDHEERDEEAETQMITRIPKRKQAHTPVTHPTTKEKKQSKQHNPRTQSLQPPTSIHYKTPINPKSHTAPPRQGWCFSVVVVVVCFVSCLSVVCLFCFLFCFVGWGRQDVEAKGRLCIKMTFRWAAWGAQGPVWTVQRDFRRRRVVQLVPNWGSVCKEYTWSHLRPSGPISENKTSINQKNWYLVSGVQIPSSAICVNCQSVKTGLAGDKLANGRWCQLTTSNWLTVYETYLTFLYKGWNPVRLMSLGHKDVIALALFRKPEELSSFSFTTLRIQIVCSPKRKEITTARFV